MMEKTRKIDDATLAQNLRCCPWCRSRVVPRQRFVKDKKTGKKKYGGEFFGCESFPQCEYWVSLDGIEKVHPDDLEESAA